MQSALKSIFNIRKAELGTALLMSFYFFLVITVFWMLKPLKKAMLVTLYNDQNPFMFFGMALGGGEAEQLAKVLNMVVAFFAATIITILSRNFVRQALVTLVSIFFIIAMLIYSLVITDPSTQTAWTFYLFGDLWTTLMVTLFFAFLSDSVTSDQAKRLFGIIGFGGVLGGAFGSNFSGFFVKTLGPTKLLLITAALTFSIIIIAKIAARLGFTKSRKKPTAKHFEMPHQAERSSSKIRTNPALEGAKLVLKSRYLLAIVGMVALYEMVSTIMDFQFTRGVLHYAATNNLDRIATGELFGKIFGITNITGLLVQLFLTSFIMTRFGVGTALMVLPVMASLGSLGFFVLPMLYTAASLTILDNGFYYSIDQSARETLYVPITQKERYRAKAFIDMFVKRSAKVVAVGINLAVPILVGTQFLNIRWLSVVTVIFLGLWIVLARYAGKEFKRRSNVSG